MISNTIKIISEALAFIRLEIYLVLNPVFFRSWIILPLLLGLNSTLLAQGAIVNELSNGPSGNQEYIELVVIGPPGNENCGPVDMQGFIFDDNNGDFSGGPVAGAGIASGHIRFSGGVWASVPVGAIILIYNATDKNPAISLPDDPLDANTDLVYIVPSDDPNIEYCASFPNSGTADDSYGPCTYSNPAVWSSIGFRNGGDAAQTRRVDGTFFHGFSFGGAPLDGGPLNISIPTSGARTCFRFENTTSDDYADVTNFVGTQGASGFPPPGESPGAPNSPENANWMVTLQSNPCPLPIEFSLFSAEWLHGKVYLHWETLSEINHDHFVVEKTHELTQPFQSIGLLNSKGSADAKQSYLHTDIEIDPTHSTYFYRLKQVDLNGNITYSKVVSVELSPPNSLKAHLFPNPANNTFSVELNNEEDFSFTLSDLQGKVQFERVGKSGRLTVDNLEKLPKGVYIYSIRSVKGKGSFGKVSLID